MEDLEVPQRDELEQGDYGDCVECGDPVGYARLKARPEAPFCIGCQSQRETPR